MGDDKVKEKSEGRNVKGIILGVSFSLVGVFAVMLLMEMLGIMDFPGSWVLYMILAILCATGPYGFYASAQLKKIRQIEAHLPDFLRDVAEAGRFGMTLANAIVVASSGRYGKLTPEIRKMAAQVEWGVPVSDTLRLFQERIDTPLVNRMVAIVIKSSDAGGSVADVLSMVAHDARETQYMDMERRMVMSTYIMVIYIAFVVFLVTILIMTSTFLPQMTKAGESLGALSEGMEGGAAAIVIEVEVIQKVMFVFLMASVIHAVGDGLIAGVLEDGKVVSGLRHSFIMTLIALLMMYSHIMEA